MPKKPKSNILAALDIGTSKVVAIVSEVDEEGRIKIIGVGSHPSSGLKRGAVVNIEATVQSIQQAVQEAQAMAGCEIKHVYTGIAGNHIKSLNSHGIVAIREKEVVAGDIERVIDAAKAVAIPADQKIIHILPQEFIIDEQVGIREPIGMSGVRLEAKVHMVTGAVSATQNIIKCVRRCGLEVIDVILQPLASSYSVLSEDEKELGVCLVDIGGGTTDIAVFTNNAIRHTAVIPIAGDHVTNDIAVALRTPTQAAERIKLEYSSVLVSHDNSHELLEVPGVGERQGQQLSKQALTAVVQARYEELFQLVELDLRRSGFENLIAAGIVLTGGGALVEGCAKLAERIFNVPVRLGHPQNVLGLEEVVQNPIYATGIGLLLYGLHQQQELESDMLMRGNVKGIWNRMRNWFQGNF